MVKVFKTDVSDPIVARNITVSLLSIDIALRIDFHLEDADRILRVEGTNFAVVDIVNCLKAYGHICIDLPIDFS